MKSPFAIFRKHQKVLMVLLVGLAMFAFIFLDSLTGTNSGQTLVPIMFVLLGAGVFWIIGTQTGKPSSYAAFGAVIGAAAGLFFPKLGAPPDAVTFQPIAGVHADDLSNRELDQLVQRRQIANNFVRAAYEKGSPFPGAMGAEGQQFQQLMIRFWQQRFDSFRFRLGNPDLREDVVFGYLLRQEAEQMGLIVSDAAVTEYIKQISTGQGARNGLTATDFRAIRNQMHIGESQLYDILRDEMQARQVMSLSVPPDFATPEQIWQQHQKLNVTAELEAAAVPVEAFVAEVKAPSQSELRELFDNHREFFPDQIGPGMPGFRQPRRISIGCLEADFETVKSQVAQVEDEEIEAFYNEQKDAYYRIDTLPDTQNVEADESKPLDPEFVPEAAKMPAQEDSADKDATDGNPPASPEPSKGGAAEKKEGPQTDTDAKTDAKEESGAKEAPKDAAPGSDKKTLPVEAESGDEDAPKEAQNAPPTEKPDAKPSQAKTPDVKASEPKKPETKAPEAKTPDVKAPEPKKAEMKAPEAKTPDVKASELKTPAAKTPEAGAPDGAKAETKESVPQYRPLDEDLKSEIRDQLLYRRTKEEMKRRIVAAMSHMRDLGLGYNAPKDDPERLTAKEIAKKMQTFAKENGLSYRQTKPLSAEELRDSEDYPIGAATEPVDNPFEAGQATTVVELLFSGESDQLYTPQEAEDAMTGSRFAYWPIHINPAHAPEFGDKGIREQVLAAWKQEQAKPKAKERADALAEIVRKAGSDEALTMAEALAEQTATGKKDAAKLPIRSTPPFAWYTRTTPSAPQLNPFESPQEPPLRLSTIPGIDKADNAFMEAVFRLKQGEVAVVANADETAYYVVKVKKRSPSETSDEDQMRQQFLGEDVFASRPHQFLSQQEQQLAYYRWGQEFLTKYGVRWNPQPDAPRMQR